MQITVHRKKIPEPPFYGISDDKRRECVTGCSENNKSYVKFLNENIHIIKRILFGDADHITIILNPIDSDIGDCVEGKKEMIYKCLCNVNYQIMVNREFHTSFLDIVIRIPQNNTNITKMEKFFAFIILLKFNPENAVFFLPTRMRNIMYFRSCPNLLKFLLHLMVKLYLEMLMVKWKIEDDLQNTRMRYL